MSAPRERPPAVLLALMAWWGYLSGAQGCVAPFLAESFGLGDAAVARLLAWNGIAALGSLALGRRADRIGRRRLLLACAAVLPFAAAGAALAPGPAAYVSAQLVLFAAGGALFGTVVVCVAESLPDGARARGQGHAGLALAAATVLPLLVTAAFAGAQAPRRAVWALAALPALALPWLWRALPESEPWQRAAAAGSVQGVRLRDLVAPAQRGRTLPAFAALLLIGAVEASTRAWLLYHPVRELGLPARQATGVLLLGGTLGLLGFRAGGVAADARGRRRTFRVAALVFALGAVGYYGPAIPPGPLGLLWLVVFLALLGAGGNAALTTFRAHAVELLPTRLRGSFGGLIAFGNALGWGLAMLGTAGLAPLLGSLGAAVAFGVALALPVAALLLAGLPETAGRPLDEGTPAGAALADGPR